MSYDISLDISFDGRYQLNLLDLNYTSNVAFMWRRALPELDGLADLGGQMAGDVAELLDRGVRRMEEMRSELEPQNPENGWGDFEGALNVMRTCAEYAREHPKAYFSVWR